MYLILVICGVFLLYFIFSRQSRKSKILRKIPGPIPLPILGNALSLNVPNEEIIGVLLRWQKQFGNRIIVHLGPFKQSFVVLQVEDVEKILSSQIHIDKSRDYDMVMPWLGTGLLTGSGKKWFYRRKLLTPTFHFKILDDFMDIFNEQSKTFVNILQKELGNGKTFDIFPYVTRCALDIICETAMGRKINAQQNRDSEYVKAIHRISEIILHRQVRPWFHPNLIWNLSSLGREEKALLKILHGFTEKVIKEKKAELVSKRKTTDYERENLPSEHDNDNFTKGRRRVAFLDLLLSAQAEGREGQLLSDLDIREETDTFMFEGHDTTAASVSWTTFLLGCNPKCQSKVQEELDAIFGDDKQRQITNTDLSRLKYLECCIKESLRLYPSVPFLGRAINTDLKLDEEITIPGGTTAFLMPYQLHRDPKSFPEPEEFIPERFFPENSIGRSPYAYIPFSAGPRNCIGQKFAMMEEKVMLASLFRSFKVQAVEKREDLILLAQLILRPKRGLKIKLQSR